VDTNKSYLRNYEKYFDPFVNKEINLLEIGVFKGESLLFWRDYFLKGTIFGLDVNKVDLEDPTGRIHIYQGAQQDLKILDIIGKKAAPNGFDIIIDDASHVGEFTQISFWHLFHNYLKPGGIFIIEDWGTGYYRKFIDGKRYKNPRKNNFVRLGRRKCIDSISNLTALAFDDKSKIKIVINKLLKRLEIISVKRRFKSHNYGLVGFVKELIDEVGMDIITSPKGNPQIKHEREINNIDIFPGQVFIVKTSSVRLGFCMLNGIKKLEKCSFFT